MDLQPGTRVTIANDVIVNGQTAFSKDEQVVIEEVSPSPDRPEYKYIVTSARMGTRFQLRDEDVSPVAPAQPVVPVQPVIPAATYTPPVQQPPMIATPPLASPGGFPKPQRTSRKPSTKILVIAGIAVVVIVGLIIGLTVGLGGGNKSGTTSETTTTETTTQSNKTFTNQNWNEVCSNPSGFQGAKVKGLVGKIFVAPEVSGGGVAIQMFADPATSEQATIVYFIGSESSQFANGDLVKVEGTVGKMFTGQNKMGGTITDPTIQATSVTKTDASALIQGGKDVAVTQQQNQNGVVVIVDKMVLRDNETDFFVRVSNQSGVKASFYAFNAKLQVGNQQFDEDSSKSNQYGQMPSDILPGVEVSGVLAFPAIGTPVPSTGAVALHLEAHSDNYMATFNPYVFNISW